MVKEKEVVEEHKTWLQEEFTAKSAALLEERKRNAELEAEVEATAEQVGRKTQQGLGFRTSM